MCGHWQVRLGQPRNHVFKREQLPAPASKDTESGGLDARQPACATSSAPYEYEASAAWALASASSGDTSSDGYRHFDIYGNTITRSVRTAASSLPAGTPQAPPICVATADDANNATGRRRVRGRHTADSYTPTKAGAAAPLPTSQRLCVFSSPRRLKREQRPFRATSSGSSTPIPKATAPGEHAHSDDASGEHA